MAKKSTPYPSDVTDEEWEFCAPYLTLMKEDAPQREHSSRAPFQRDPLHVRAGCPWRMIPHDLPPWSTVHQQGQRWIKAGCFEAMAHDLRKLLRKALGDAVYCGPVGVCLAVDHDGHGAYSPAWDGPSEDRT